MPVSEDASASAAGRSGTIAHIQVDVAAAHLDAAAAQPSPPVDHALSRREVELPAVPRTDQPQILLGQAFPPRIALPVEDLLVAADQTAGADRTALVDAAVLVGEDAAVELEDPDLAPTEVD